MNEKDFKAAQILALRSVEDPTFEDTFRRIQRWYSNQFHIPLDRIDTVPDEEIVRAWFEDRFTIMKNSPDEKVRGEYEMLKDSILFEKDEQAEASEDDEWEKQMLEEIKKEQGLNSPQDPNLDNTPDHVNLNDIADEYVPDED